MSIENVSCASDWLSEMTETAFKNCLLLIHNVMHSDSDGLAHRLQNTVLKTHTYREREQTLPHETHHELWIQTRATNFRRKHADEQNKHAKPLDTYLV